MVTSSKDHEDNSPDSMAVLSGDTARPAVHCENDVAVVSGDWVAGTISADLSIPHDIREVDATSVGKMDGVGAALLVELASGRPVEFGSGDRQRFLFDRTISAGEPERVPELGANPLASFGKQVISALTEVSDLVQVQGRIVSTAAQSVLPGRGVRLASFVSQFQETVLKAIPVVCLISLVVGIILTQQSILQLRTFGATIFVVDLAGILMLREVGVILAAIMVAGRSGSAFAAEIGAMRMREETDALEVMGLDTYRMVVLPRAAALVVGMPALALLGAISGIAGAAIVARLGGGISFDAFSSRLAAVVDFKTIALGIVKAPVMALAVTVIAVREGFRVSGSTESLGRHTTSAVVKSIFAVILIDGLFAVYYAALGF